MTSANSELFHPLTLHLETLDVTVPDIPKSTVILTDFTVFHDEQTKPHTLVETPDAYQAGYQAGMANAEARHVETVKAMEQSVQHLGAGLLKTREDIESSHGRVIRMCLDAVLSNLAHHTMRVELEQFLRDFALTSLDGELTISCHPANHSARNILKNVSFGVHISIKDNSELATHKIVCEWDDGRTSIDPDNIVSALETILSSTLDT